MAAQVTYDAVHLKRTSISGMTTYIYCFFSPWCILLGLFERHKLLFSFNMTIKIEQAVEGVPQDELEFFIKGETIMKLKPIFNM